MKVSLLRWENETVNSVLVCFVTFKYLTHICGFPFVFLSWALHFGGWACLSTAFPPALPFVGPRSLRWSPLAEDQPGEQPALVSRVRRLESALRGRRPHA